MTVTRKKILPFQVLSTCARKNVVMSETTVEVCIFAFDVLYLNGQPLLQEQLDIHSRHLYKSFEEEPGFFEFSVAITTNDLEEIQKFLRASFYTSFEGLIIKTLNKDATYGPSKQSHSWLKMKKDYIGSIGDSLDWCPLLLSMAGEKVFMVHFFLLVMITRRRSSGAYVKLVWEVKAADLTISPVRCAAVGIVDPDKGISLCFPRLLWVREDKSTEVASSSEMVAEMYSAQKHAQDNQVVNEAE